MKKAKKVLSMLLALTLLLTSVQMPVFAAQTDGEMTEARAPEADKAEASFDEDAAAPDPASNAVSAETENAAATNAANADAGIPAEAFAGAESAASAAADNAPALEQPAFAGEKAAEEAANADAGAETSDEEAANADAGAETSDEAAAETAAGVSLLEDEQWLEAGILNADLSLEGNYVFREGTLDLNGHTLTISGSLLHTGGDLLVNGGTLLVTGDYRIQNRKDDGSYEGCNGALIMIHEEDQVTIGGDFYASGSWHYYDSQADKWQDYMLTAGTLTIGKGLHQCYRGDSFRAKDAHKTVFAGAGEGKTCEVSFESADSYLGIVEMAEGAAIFWTGVFNVETLGNDVAVTAPAGEAEGIEICSKDARMKYNGHALTVNGNVKNLVGQMYVGGAALAGESFDAAKAGSLTVNGDFLQQDGDLIADGGRVHVTGDWRIQHRKDDGTYESCNAALVMMNEADDVSADGDFYVSGNWHYYDSRADEWQDYMLTAGTLTIGKGLHQCYRGDSFRAKDAHKTVFAGAGEGKTCEVSFESADSCLGIVEMAEGAAISWTGAFNVETLGNDVAVTAPAGEAEGIEIYSKDARMKYNGHELTINGNVKNLVGQMYVGGAALAGESFDAAEAGSLTVNGDFLQQDGDLIADGGRVHVTGDWRIQHRKDDGTYEGCNAALVMTHEADDVAADGDFYVSGNWHYYDSRTGEWHDYMLTAGTLTIGKSLRQCNRNDSFRAKDAHKTVFAGAGEGKTCEVSFESADSCLGVVEMAEGAAISWTGVFNVETLGNDVAVTAPAGEAEGIEIYSKDARMKYNGHELTINGNVKNLVGQMYVGGAALAGESFDATEAGSLAINGDFLQQDGDLIADGGKVHVTGDWRIQHRKDDGTYEGCNAALVMTHEADDVSADGDFYVSGNWHYYDSRTGEWQDYMLTAGTLTIGKSLRQCNRNDSFRAKDAHKTVFAGAGEGKTCEVSFESADSCLGIVEMAEGAAISWTGIFNVETLGNDVAVTAPAGEAEGIEIYSKDARMKYNGKKLTINGNVKNLVGQMYVGGAALAGESFDAAKAGSFTVNGDFLQQDGDLIADGGKVHVTGDWRIQHRKDDGTYEGCGAALVMVNEADDVSVDGDFYVSGNWHYYDSRTGEWQDYMLTAGTLTLKGGFCQRYRGDAFRATGTHKTVLSGKGAVSVQFESRDSYFAELELTKSPENCFFSRVPCWSKATYDGRELSAEDFPFTAVYEPGSGRLTLTSWKDTSAEIEIPAAIAGVPVTGLGGEIFKDRTDLVKITLPASLETITDGAFWGCTGLTAVSLPAAVKEIGRDAFRDCTGLVIDNLPAGLKTIGESAFRNCAALCEAVLPDTLETIGTDAFRDCVSLAAIFVPASVTALGNGAFQNCQSLAEAAFAKETKLTELPERIFSGCVSLPGFELPASITRTGYESFRDCKAFTEFTVPKTVTELGTSTFLFCENLAAVNFEAGSGLKLIGESAFEDCAALTEIRIPDGTENIGHSAFCRCKGLKKAVVPATVTTMGTQAFRETALGTAGPLGSGADYEFGWIDEIPDYGFDFITSLRTAVLPDSVRSIGSYAFSECHGLTEVQLPQGLTSLGSAAFNSCESLEYITIPAGVTVLPQEIFRKCGSLVDVDLSESLTEIGRSAFEGCDSLAFLVLPDNVEIIRRNAFRDCRSLEQMILPESVTELEEDIFNYKEKLLLCVFPGSAALDYAVEKEIPYTLVSGLGHTLTAKAVGAEGEALASGFTVSWYDAEKDTLLGTGAKLRNVEKGAKILCRVVLGESLGSVYVQPDYKTAEMGDQDMTVDFALKAFGTAVIRGVVRDTEGNVLSGVPVTLTQTFNCIYEKTLSAVTSKSGSFAFNAAGRTGSFVTVGADGYFEQTVAVSDTELAEGEADVRVTLEKIPENKVTLELLVREAAEDGAEPETAELAGAANLVIKVYNETEGRDVPDFRIQYPNLVLGEKAAKAGDVLRLSLVSGGTLTAEDVTLTLDENRCGSVSWTFVRNGSVKLTNVKQISGGKSGVSVMVFDADGKCAESGQTAAGGYATGALPEGTYTLVLMEKTGLLRSVDSYGKLGEFGLNPDTDFAAFEAEVKNGKIREIDGAEVPAFDESKLYYTLKDSTRVWANVSRTTTGQYVTVRAQYEIDPKHTSTQETLLLEIPAGMTFVEKSLTLNSKASLCTVTANEDGTTSVSVPVNAAKGTARFYVLPNAGGLHKVHAYLSFKTGGALVTQPLGAASVETAKATLRVPSQTSQKKITATGTAIAGCEITVYDNGTAVGTLTAKKSGTWSLTFDLVKPGKCTVHEIYALVESADYGHIETDPARVLFNQKYSDLSKVTMINTAHTSTTCEFRTVFDFLNPATAVPSYNYWPAYPTFTFLVEFTGNAAAMEEVEVVTTNAAGDKTLVPCSYDPKSGKWIGVHNYLSFEQVPCRVGVYSANLSGSEPDMSVDPEEMVSILKKAKEMEDPLVAKVSELASVENPAFGSETVSFDLKLGEDKIGVYSVEMLDYEDFDLGMLSDKTYVEYIDENEQLSYQWEEITEDSFITYYAYTMDRLYGRETLRFVLPEDWVLDDEDLAGASAEVLAGAMRPLEELFGNLLSEESEPAAEEASAGFSFDSLGGMFKRLKIIQKYAGAFRTILGWVSNYEAYEEITEGFAKLGPYVEALNNTLDFLRQTINRKKCPCEGAADSWKSVENMYNSLKKEIENYKIKAYVLMGGSLAANILMQYAGGQAVKFAGKGGMAGVKALYKYVCQRFGKQVMTGARTVFVQGTRALGEGVGAYADSKFGNLSSFIHSLFDIRGHIEDGYRRIDQSIRTWIGAANTTYCPCILKTGVCECNHKNPEVPDQPAEPIADPSGYVYEAVPSNRLEGVKAEIYEYTYAVDEFGIPADEKSEILWDAASYDQVNPQLTREDGTFGWDVPEGQWLVKFTKEGYEDADSRKDAAVDKDGYLPVPPIQTEVNTAMVSKASPEVANAAAYPTEVQIDFTQYMQIDTVNTANVTVTADGSLVAGTIVPLNNEDNCEGTKQFASSFAYRFADEVSGKLAISVKNAKNYNGRAMAAAFEKAETVAPMPKSLEITGATEIPHHGSRTLTVKVVPAEAGYGKTLRFKSYSPSIASANAETAVVGKSGTATFTVSGELPGQAIFEVSLEGTKLSEELEIAVTPEAAAVKSIEDYPVSLAEDTLVYDGTEKTPAVTVTGLTEGTDYTAAYDSNINAGEASVTVTGAGAYTGTVTLNFTIAPADIDGAEVGALADATYTGKAKKPVPAVTFGGKALISGTDYDISYENNVNAGEAKAVLTGKGNFTGTKTAAFVINKATQKLACKVSAIAVGEKATLAVTGMKGGTLTVTSSDKTVLKVVKTAQSTKKFQVQALKVGTVKLTIKAGISDNYKSASLKVTVKVVPAATTKIAVTNLSKGLKVAWAKVTGATGYLVYCNNKLIKTITSGKTASLTHTKANTNGTKYVYKIVATAATGQSTLSKSATAYRLAQPAIFAAKNSAAGTLGLKWGKNAKATGYQIEYSTGKTFKTVKKATVKKAATVTAKIAKLTKDKTYYVRLRAYKTVSGKTYFSAYSAAKAVKITK